MIDQNIECKDHPEEHVRLYCKDCQILICNSCLDSTHKTHSLESTESALEHVKPKLMQCKEKVENIIQENEDNLAKAISHAEDLKKEYEDLEGTVDNACEELIKQIRSNCKKAKEKIASIKGKQMDKLEKYISGLELRLKSQRNSVALTNTAFEEANDANLLHIINHHIHDRLVM